MFNFSLTEILCESEHSVSKAYFSLTEITEKHRNLDEQKT